MRMTLYNDLSNKIYFLIVILEFTNLEKRICKKMHGFP